MQELQNRPINVKKLDPAKLKKYTKLKVGSDYQPGDLVHLINDEYVEISKDNLILKEKVNQYVSVFRKK
jgi:hypothetical protein